MERPCLFDALICQYYNDRRRVAAARRYIRRISKGRADSFEIEDIFHQSIATILECQKAWQLTTIEQLDRWMWGIMRNCTLHYLRACNKVIHHFNGDDPEHWNCDGTMDLLQFRNLCYIDDGIENSLTVKQLLQGLKPVERTLLILHYWYGYTFKEIAMYYRKAGDPISEECIRVRHHRIIARLKKSANPRIESNNLTQHYPSRFPACGNIANGRCTHVAGAEQTTIKGKPIAPPSSC